MSSIAHGTFVIERSYPVPPKRAFAAWSDPAQKARWFIGPEGWKLIERALDFRVGGDELLHGKYDAWETLFRARYHAIVPDQRIVYVYDMFVGGKHHSLSLATVEFHPEGKGTKQVFTEQVAFLDGTAGPEGTASRERGTAAHLDRMAPLFSA